ncbi:P-loop containing nucleoside triphosphate hydrolase protein [Clohesyomyces aquaticus]|uniref:p-loop containing nucleoside triphosphate hydrolase protein n=1 Tax=Clohesyomyces aquaticus TaxID=1231657 RepID=A0A1Y2A3G6_9PLEO|nr:P-loop containing nucleoside triphosphate hydrolase protein [Clohesyomyces aquaticus]
MEKLDGNQSKTLNDQLNGLSPNNPPKTVFHLAERLDIVILCFSCIAAIIAGGANPLLAVLYGQLAGSFAGFQNGTLSGSELNANLSRFCLYFVYLAVGTFVATYVSTVGFYYTGDRITKTLRTTYLKTIIRQNMAFFDTLGSGELTSRITSDISLIQEGITGSLAMFLTAAATFVSAFVIAYVAYWKLALALSSTLVVMFFTGGMGIAYPVKWTKESRAMSGRGATIVEEAIGSIRHVTAFGIQDNLVRRYDEYLQKAEKPALKGGIGVALAVSVMQAVPYLTYGLSFWFGSILIVRGETNTASVTTATLAIVIGAWTIGRVTPSAKAFLSSISSASVILESISRKSTEDPFSEDGLRLTNGNQDITFQNVQLIYPSRPEVTVLDDLNLVVPAAKTTAIVGASGCGKSSIIGLLERFYKPTRGSILLGNSSIHTLNLRWLRSQIALVSQEPMLFNATILENIVYGLEDAVASLTGNELKAHVEDAARTANAHDFISNLPDGYNTEVGEKGMQLSGGQRQRLCIARAIIKNPSILLLDEATSALDVEAEQQVQRAMSAASKGRTTVVVAHRLSTIRNADNIVVMSNGGIVEQGNHNDLIAKGGYYAELVAKQQLSKVPPSNLVEEFINEKQQDADEVLEKQRLFESPPPSVKAEEARKQSPTTSIKPVEQPKSGFTWRTLFTALKFILHMNKPEAILVVFAILLAIVAGLAVPAQSIIFAKLLNALSLTPANVLRDTVNFWSSMYLAMGLSFFAVWLGQSVGFAYTTERLVHRTREQSFRAVLRQEVGFFDMEENSTGALTSLLSSAPADLKGLDGTIIGVNVSFLSTIVGGIILSVVIAWKLALVCTATIPVVAGFGWIRLAMLTLFAQKIKKSHADSAAYASEAASTIRTVASLNMESRILKRYDEILSKHSKESIRSILSASTLYAASQSVTFLCAALAFWYGGTLIAKENYTVFQFFVCFAALISGAQRAGLIFSYASGMSKAISASKDLKTLFNRQPSIDTWSASGENISKATFAGEIEFQNVSFSYPLRKDRVVIDDLNITIKPGQNIALVGPSGCGKSTVIALLERFYEPTSGQILVDGKNITGLNLTDYRNLLALVGQESTMYTGTIRENLTLGLSDEVSEETVLQACKEANILDFITSLPDGFLTQVGSKGVMLSGGQKQRLSIARAILRDARILLLDEATASLDSVSEEAVQAALNRASEKRTTIAIAHRLSTTRNSDVIFVMEGGRVVEIGNHSELIGKFNGVYKGLVQKQNLAEEEEH